MKLHHYFTYTVQLKIPPYQRSYPSAEKVRPHPPKKCPRYDAKLHVIRKLYSETVKSVEYPFTAITPRFTLTRNGSIC